MPFDFLKESKIRAYYSRIVLLDFQENPIKEIQGSITSGSLNVNGNSATRRTINLSMVANQRDNDLTNINSDISLNKKVKIYIGYKDILHSNRIIWLLCGLFIINNANISRGLSSTNISISGTDKMSILDGSVGGILQASTIFHELQETDGKYKKIPIQQIIREAVHHLGQENPNNIIINDIPEKSKRLVKYMGDSPIYFNVDYSQYQNNYDKNAFPNKCSPGQDIGYMPIDTIYPGELILSPGDNIVSLLSKISQTFGNYEFFYNTDGDFVFQKKKNYLNQADKSLIEININDYFSVPKENSNFINFSNLKDIISINNNPDFKNIKNDFIVWGEKPSVTGKSGVKIRYHLAIDKKPEENPDSYCKKYCYKKKDGTYVLRNSPEKEEEEETLFSPIPQSLSFEWREELYRHALLRKNEGSPFESYDRELLEEWRKIYNPSESEWVNGWNPDIKNNITSLNYWLDFIDEDSTPEIKGLSISSIGRRSKVIVDNKIHSVYNNTVPDLIFLNREDPDYNNLKNKYAAIGQKFISITKSEAQRFITSSTSASAFDKIRELLNRHLVYNTRISLTCLPRYDLEPNTILYINDKISGVRGFYEISDFSLPLTYSGTMTINAVQMLNQELPLDNIN